jgi:hypothetical protein
MFSKHSSRAPHSKTRGHETVAHAHSPSHAAKGSPLAVTQHTAPFCGPLRACTMTFPRPHSILPRPLARATSQQSDSHVATATSQQSEDRQSPRPEDNRPRRRTAVHACGPARAFLGRALGHARSSGAWRAYLRPIPALRPRPFTSPECGRAARCSHPRRTPTLAGRPRARSLPLQARHLLGAARVGDDDVDRVDLILEPQVLALGERRQSDVAGLVARDGA